MSLTKLWSKKDLQFLLFGGKGGVGKTSCASACATAYARKFPKKKILIFTTDPAPSLGDVFEQQLTYEPSQIKNFKNLWAMELEASQELKNFKKKYGEDILDILQEGTYLSDQETEEMFSLDIPGLDEVMGLKKITDFMESSDYDLYILDTAPTGHTLRLLALPELLDNWIKFLAKLRWKYHYMVDRFSRGQEKRVAKADEFLLEMKKTVKRVQQLLKDPNKTEFVTVTIPESLGVAETKDLIADLKKFKIPSEHIIINNIVPEDKSAFLQKRRQVQDEYIKVIKKSFSSYTITEIELQADEIRGLEKLEGLGEKLFTIYD
jgi:arsenite/tail-anchored protein-transporting ATPase